MPRKRKREDEDDAEDQGEDWRIVPRSETIMTMQPRFPIQKKILLGTKTFLGNPLHRDNLSAPWPRTAFGFTWELNLLDGPNDPDPVTIVPEPTVIRWTIYVQQKDTDDVPAYMNTWALPLGFHQVENSFAKDIIATGWISIYPSGVETELIPPDVIDTIYAKGPATKSIRGRAKTKRRIRGKGEVNSFNGVTMHFIANDARHKEIFYVLQWFERS